MSPEILLGVYVALFGLVVGSYLNVVVHRLPRRMSTVLPHSRCPRCRVRIRPWDNLPLLSFLLLRGRCRHCGFRISWRYPLVEALTAVCFVVSYRLFGLSADGVVAAVFCAAMVALAMIDLEHFLLPDAITKPGIAVGLLAQLWVSWSTPLEALIGALLGAGVLAAVSWGWYWWRGVHGMGFGDVKMLAMVGAFLGWKGTVVTFFLSTLTGAATSVALILAGRLGLGSKIPFGAFLALGAVLSLFYGQELFDGYLEVAGRLLLPLTAEELGGTPGAR